ncbi:MAG: DUF4258 domain-containing protein [Leptolyngbyaceae cyanobacterium RM1_406_9]|nr:DUF4258 domain-containing protein [Leptolyngbyaceae cyanobacterium RM1_406_9]
MGTYRFPAAYLVAHCADSLGIPEVTPVALKILLHTAFSRFCNGNHRPNSTKIRNRDYYLSSHAEDEMVDDYLERQDVEHAILRGQIRKTMTHDTRGTRYQIEGSTIDGRLIHVICRFRDEGSLIIITVYALMEDK